MKKEIKIISQLITETLVANKDFLKGIFFTIFVIFIIIGFIPVKILFQFFEKYQDIIYNIGILGIILFIVHQIVKMINTYKLSVGFIFLPFILVLLPIISSNLTNKYSILFSTIITILYSIYIITSIPEDLRSKLILKWKLVNTIFFLASATFSFIYFLMPEKILSIPIENIKEKIKNLFFGSVFIYSILKSSVEILEYKIDNKKNISKKDSLCNNSTSTK